jgi:hypothetical protein
MSPDIIQPPTVEVELIGSAFGLGTLWDRVEFRPQHQDSYTRLNATLVLAFVEGVLGYRVVYQEGHQWHFRRDTSFG